jgi:ABC-type glutathione transport system ATPase component
MVSEVLFIGGGSGVGKTTVGLEIHSLLRNAGIAHGVIDGDLLDLAYPTPWGHNLAERNLTALWSNYHSLGYRRLIYINTASVLPKEMRKLAEAMGDAPRISAVLLTCSDASVRERLGRRETGTGLQRHLEASSKMAALLQDKVEGSVRQISTDSREAREVAADVVAVTDWCPDVP